MSDELTTEQVREIAQYVLAEWMPGYHHPGPVTLDQIQLCRMADGSYRADPADGPRAEGALGTYRIAVTVERVDARGYCARCDHADHRCPGCGIDVPHGTHVCERCNV